MMAAVYSAYKCIRVATVCTVHHSHAGSEHLGLRSVVSFVIHYNILIFSTILSASQVPFIVKFINISFQNFTYK